MALRAPEWITVAYFLYLAGAAAVLPQAGLERRRRAIGAAIIVIVTVLAVARLDTGATWWREWMPLIYMVIGYWLPSLLVSRMDQAFEDSLLALDRRWQVTTISERAPRLVIELLELAYLFCYPMVPLGFAC